MNAIRKLIETHDNARPCIAYEHEMVRNEEVFAALREALPELRDLTAKVARYEAWLRERIAECDEAIADADGIFGVRVAAAGTRKRAAELRELLGEK